MPNNTQRGLDALKPADHLNEASPEIQEELNARSPGIQAEVEAKSAAPKPVNVYDKDGIYFGEGKVRDGDGVISQRRLGYDDSVEHRGKALDTWEVSLPPGEGGRKKVDKQRERLAELSGMDIADITDEDVFAMGRNTAERARKFFQTSDGINRVDLEGDTFKGKFGRAIGEGYINHKGEDLRDFLNNPRDNVDFDAPWNIRGKAAFELPNQRVRKGEIFSDYEAQHTITGRVANALSTAGEATVNMLKGITDAGSKSTGELVSDIFYKADITPADETTYKDIKKIEAQALKDAQLERDKEDAPRLRHNRNIEIEAAKNSAIADLKGEPLNALDISSGYIPEPEGRVSVEERAQELFLSRLSKEQLALKEGKGEAFQTSDFGRDKTEAEKKAFPPKRVKDDRFKKLELARKTRTEINKAAVLFGTSGDINPYAGETGDIDLTTGALLPSQQSNRSLAAIKSQDKDVLQANENAKVLANEGKYLQAAGQWFKGAVTSVVKHPEATVLGALQAAPEMVAFVMAPKLAIMGNVHRTYEEGINHFYNERGTLPNKSQRNTLLVTSVAKGLLEKAGAEILVGSIGRETSKALIELLGKKLSFSVAQATNIVSAATVEGGEELLVSMLEQYGKNQGQEKVWDPDVLYQAWVEGFGVGGVIKGGTALPSIPGSIVKDVARGARVVAKATVGVNTPQNTPEKRQEVKDQLIANLAKSEGTTTEQILTPNIILTPESEHDFQAQAAGVIPEASTEVPAEVDTATKVVEAFDTLRKDLESNSFKTVKDMADLVASRAAAAAAHSADLLSMQGSSVTSEQLESISQRQQQLDHASARIDVGIAAVKDSQVETPKDAADVALLLTRGSQDVAKVDIAETQKLDKDVADLVVELAALDSNIKSARKSRPNNMQETEAEVLGNRVNAKNKKGLAKHLNTLGALISKGEKGLTATALRDLINFQVLQQKKHDAIAKGYAKFKKINEGKKGTPEEVTVNYGKDDAGTFVISDGRTERVLQQLQKEIDILKQGAKLVGDLAQARFDPDAFAKRKGKEQAETEVENKAEARKVQEEAAARPATATPKEITEQPDLFGESDSTPLIPEEGGVAVNEPSNESEANEAGEVEVANTPEEGQQIPPSLPKRPKLKVRLKVRPKAPVAPAKKPKLKVRLKAVIKDSMPVEPRVPVDKPSKAEKQDKVTFDVAEIEAAQEAAQNTKVEDEVSNSLLDKLVNWSKQVKRRASTKLEGEKYADSASTKLLRPLKEMLVEKFSSKNITGIFKREENVWEALKGMSDIRFTPDEWDAVTAIESFVAEMGRTLDAIMPEVGIDTPIRRSDKQANTFIIFKQLANRSPVYEFVNEKGELEPRLKNAMGVAILDWVQTTAKSTSLQTAEDIYNFYGLDPDTNELHPAIINWLADKGVHSKPQAERIGAAVLDLLNVKQSKNPELDGRWEKRLKQSIGDMALIAMSNMHTTPADSTQLGENRGYLDLIGIPAKTLTDAGETTPADAIQETAEDDTALARFIRVPFKWNNDGTRLYSDSTQQLFTLTGSTEFKSVMKAIQGTHRAQGGVSALAENFTIPKFYAGTTSKLSPLLARYVKYLNSHTLNKTPQWDLMEAFEVDNKEGWLKMHGWVQPTVDPITGEIGFPEMHDAQALSQLGKNLSVEQEYEKTLQHDEEWAAGLKEVQDDIGKTEEALILAALEADEAGVKPKLGKLRQRLAKLQREEQAYVNQDIHLQYKVIRTGRTQDQSKTLSVQKYKMHRGMLGLKSAVETINITDKKQRELVILGLIDPLNLDEAATSREPTKVFEAEYVDANGHARDPVIRAAIEAIQSFTAKEKDADGNFTFDKEAIVKAVLQLKEGPHSLTALMTVASWSTARQRANQGGDPTFKNYGYTEVDGTTNGIMLSLRQLPAGYDPAEAADPKEGSKTWQIMRTLNATGMSFTDQNYVDAIDYLENNPDAYENIGNLASKNLEELFRAVEGKSVRELKDNLDAAWKIYNDVRAAVTKNRALERESKDAFREVENAQSEYGAKVFKSTTFDFSLDKNNKVSRDIRTMMKSIVMPGAYQAGNRALANTLFYAWLETAYTNMALAVNEREASSTGPYRYNLDDINLTLKSAGIDYTVRVGNAKRMFRTDTVKKLKKLYVASLGKSITDAYRESMGDFDGEAKAISAVWGVQGILFKKLIDAKIAKREKQKGGVGLTDSELFELRLELQKEGAFVGEKQYGATGFEDSASIVKEERQEVSEGEADDRGGNVTTPFAKGAITTKIYRLSNDEARREETVKTSNWSSRIDEYVPSADIGVSGNIGQIHHMDGNTQAASALESKIEAINVFDAKITAATEAVTEAEITNSTQEMLMREYSVWDGVIAQMKQLLSMDKKAEHSQEILNFFTKYDPVTKKGNKNAPIYLDAEGFPHYFTQSEGKSALDNFIAYVEEKQKVGNALRETVNNNIESSQNMRIKGGASTRYKNSNPEGERGSASADGRIDYRTFEEAMRSNATPERVSELFRGYLNRNNIKDSAAHKARLTELMEKYILPLVRSTTGYTVSVDVARNATDRVGGVVVEGKHIYIRTSDTAIRKFSTDMSDAEVLTHEFLHPIIEAGLADNTKSINELLKLQQQVIDSPTFTPESLVDPTNTNQTEALEKAQRLYDYITGDIQEFMTFGLSNNVIRTALEAEAVTPLAPTGVINKMLSILQNLIAALTGKVIGRTAAPTNVASSLDTLIQGFDTTTRVHRAKQVSSILNNKYVNKGRGFLADKVAGPVVRWGERAAYSVPVGRMNEEGVTPTKKEILLALAKSPVRVFDSGFQREAKTVLDTVVNYREGFFAKVAREALGNEIDRPYHLLLSEVNEHVDSASLRYSKTIKEKIEGAFSRSLKDSELKLLADTLLRGDLKVFRDMSIEGLAELVSVTDVLDARIQTTGRGLQSTDKRWIKAQTQNLGSVMIKGESLLEDGNLNAFNIATGLMHPQDGRGITINDKQAIDELKSLYAIKAMSVEARNKLATMLMAEPEAIKLILEVDAVNHANTLLYTYDNDESRVVAGEVMSKSTNNSSVVILPRRDHARHEAAGLTLIRPWGERLGLYTRPDIPGEGYQKGVFSMGNTELEGTPVRPEDNHSGTFSLPVVSGGRVIGRRVIMDARTREIEAGMSIGVTESLGNHGGRTIRLQKGGTFNAKIIDYAYQDYLANGTTRGFVKITTNSVDPSLSAKTNAQISEFARLMPREMRNKIKAQWNGDMYLRKDQLDLLIGFRKLSLVDTINQRRVAAGGTEMPAAISSSLSLAGDVWQGVIAEVKKRTVLFLPAVVGANFLSNLAVSVLQGMNPVDVARDQKEGLTAIRAYTAWQDDISALDLEISLGNNVQANEQKKARIVKAMKSSGVHTMVEAGMFQSIVEDIDISAGSEASPLNTVVRKVLPEAANEAVSGVYRQAPNSIKTGLGILMLSPSTEFGANVQAATAYADFVARYALIKHLKKQGMSEVKAMEQAKDVFVDYAPNTSRELQYINDVGMFMYTKFMLRIQRVIMRAFKNHPETVIAFEAAQAAMGNAPDIVDASFMWGFPMSGGRTTMPDEAAEQILQLPFMYLLNGLRDLFG